MTLPAGMVTRLQSGRRDHARLTASLAGIGGSSWTQKRASGTGRTARPTEASLGVLTGYVYRVRPTGVAALSVPDFVPTDAWQFVTDGSPSLLEDDTLTSVADTSLVFTVRSVEQRSGYTVAVVEQP